MATPLPIRRSYLPWMLQDSTVSAWPILIAGAIATGFFGGFLFLEEAPYGASSIALFVDIVFLNTFWSVRLRARKSLYASLPVSSATSGRLGWIECFVLIPGVAFSCQTALFAVRSAMFGLDGMLFYTNAYMLLTTMGIMAILWRLSDVSLAHVEGWKAWLHGVVLLLGLFLNLCLVIPTPGRAPADLPISHPYVAGPVALLALGAIAASFFWTRYTERYEERASARRWPPLSFLRVPDWPILRALTMQDIFSVVVYFVALLGIALIIGLSGKERVGILLQFGVWLDYGAVFSIPTMFAVLDLNELKFYRVLPVSAARLAAINLVARGLCAALAALPVIVMARWVLPERELLSYAAPFLLGLSISFLAIGFFMRLTVFYPVLLVLYGGLIGFVSIRTLLINMAFADAGGTPAINLETTPSVLLGLIVLFGFSILTGHLLMKRGIQRLQPTPGVINIEERVLGIKGRSFLG